MHASKPHILIVDDDARLRSLVARYVWGQGFVPLCVPDASSARILLRHFIFDVLVVDVMMPGENGLTFIQNLPPDAPPVLLLTALGEAQDRVGGLRVGADDYVTKPFEPEELALRLRALIRRTKRSDPERIGSWQLIGDRLEGPYGVIDLTFAELGLLRALIAARGKSVSRQDLAIAASLSGRERSVDVLITRLRRKIESAAPLEPTLIRTLRSVGYALQI